MSRDYFNIGGWLGQAIVPGKSKGNGKGKGKSKV